MMIPANKVFLTEEQDAYLRENYETIINDTLCKHLGVSVRTLVRLARERGLTKDRAAIEGQRREKLSKAVRESLRKKGYKGNPQNGIVTRFKKGFNAIEFFGREKFDEMHKKSVETRKKHFAEERARVTFGLPKRTNMKVSRQPRAKISARNYLKGRRYIIDDVNNIAYYTEDTIRSYKLEAKPKRFYTFKPYEQQREQEGIQVAD